MKFIIPEFTVLYDVLALLIIFNCIISNFAGRKGNMLFKKHLAQCRKRLLNIEVNRY